MNHDRRSLPYERYNPPSDGENRSSFPRQRIGMVNSRTQNEVDHSKGSYHDPWSREHQRTYRQSPERPQFQNFGNDDVHSERNHGGFDNQNERYNVARGYERGSNTRGSSSRGGRDFSSWIKEKNQINYFNEENYSTDHNTIDEYYEDQRNGYDKPSRDVPARGSFAAGRTSYRSDHQDNNRRHSRDVPARGSFASGRTSYRPDHQDNDERHSRDVSTRGGFAAGRTSYRPDNQDNDGRHNNDVPARGSFASGRTSYRPDHQDNDERHSRDVPTRGGFAAGRTSYRPDNQDNDGKHSNDVPARGSFASGRSSYRSDNQDNNGRHSRDVPARGSFAAGRTSYRSYNQDNDERHSRDVPTRGGFAAGRSSYRSDNQDNDVRHSKDVPARGSFAAGRSSYRPDNQDNAERYSRDVPARGSFAAGLSSYRSDNQDKDGRHNNDVPARGSFAAGRSSYRSDNQDNDVRHSRDVPARGSFAAGRSSYRPDNQDNNGRHSRDVPARGSFAAGRTSYRPDNENNYGRHNRDVPARGSFAAGRSSYRSDNQDNGYDGVPNSDSRSFTNNTRASFRGGRGRGRSFNSDFGSSFDSRGPRNDAFSDNPATDQARAPRGWVPEHHDVEKDFEEDRNKEQYSKFDMDEKFKTTGGKDIQYKTWDQTGLHATLLTNLIEKSRFKKLRPIQGRVIPHVLAKKNLLGHSQTGSGKTLAYVLPILHQLLNSKSFDEEIFHNPKVLVLVPTRELAVQVSNEFCKFASGTNINVGRAFGQYSRNLNWADIEHSHVIVGTIGRLKDFLSSDLDVNNLSHIVLDEADKILKDTDRAFRDMISTDKFKRIIPRCQVLMFTATLPEAFNRLTDDLLGKDYVTITNEERLKANNHVEQIYVYTESRKEKHEELRKIIENYSNVKILIFVKTKDMADILSASFEQEGIKVESLHGGRPQDLRSKIFNNFKAGGTQIVIGTDVCGRGWDVDGLDIVVNFDMPSAKESLNDCLDTFIHRIGRTGRMKTGKAITFIGDEDKDFVPHLIKLCQASQQEVPEFMMEMEKSFVEAGISRTFGQPSFGRTYFDQQSNTNEWDLTTTSAEHTEVSASAAPNSSIPSSGDPWTSSSGWGESTQNEQARDNAWTNSSNWGDDVENDRPISDNVMVAEDTSAAPNTSIPSSEDVWRNPTGWGDSVENEQAPDNAWTNPSGWGDDVENDRPISDNAMVAEDTSAAPNTSIPSSEDVWRNPTCWGDSVENEQAPDNAWTNPSGGVDNVEDYRPISDNAMVAEDNSAALNTSIPSSEDAFTNSTGRVDDVEDDRPISDNVVVTEDTSAALNTSESGSRDALTNPTGGVDDVENDRPISDNVVVTEDTSAALNTSIPSSEDALTNSTGRVDDVEDDVATVVEKGSKIHINIKDKQAQSVKSTEKSKEDIMELDVTTSHAAQDISFGAFDDWDTSGAVWGSGTTNVKANVQSDDEDENLLPSDSKEDGGGDY